MALTNKTRGGLAAIVGAAAAAALLYLVPNNEGTVLKTYKDLGGVLTYCTGATEDAQWGKSYTKAECAAQLNKDLERHAAGIQACMQPSWDRLTDGQKIAYVDTAFNIGVAAFCGSTMAKATNAGDVVKGCAALALWVNVNGKPVNGLVKRRAIARAFCEGRTPV